MKFSDFSKKYNPPSFIAEKEENIAPENKFALEKGRKFKVPSQPIDQRRISDLDKKLGHNKPVYNPVKGFDPNQNDSYNKQDTYGTDRGSISSSGVEKSHNQPFSNVSMRDMKETLTKSYEDDNPGKTIWDDIGGKDFKENEQKLLEWSKNTPKATDFNESFEEIEEETWDPVNNEDYYEILHDMNIKHKALGMFPEKDLYLYGGGSEGYPFNHEKNFKSFKKRYQNENYDQGDVDRFINAYMKHMENYPQFTNNYLPDRSMEEILMMNLWEQYVYGDLSPSRHLRTGNNPNSYGTDSRAAAAAMMNNQGYQSPTENYLYDNDELWSGDSHHLFRGLSYRESDRKKRSQEDAFGYLKPGDIIKDPGFMSSSQDMSWASEFANSGNGVIMDIFTGTNRNDHYVPHNPGQGERVFYPNTKLTYRGKTPYANNFMYHFDSEGHDRRNSYGGKMGIKDYNNMIGDIDFINESKNNRNEIFKRRITEDHFVRHQPTSNKKFDDFAAQFDHDD